MKSTKIYILKLLRLVLDYEHGLEFVRHKLSSKSPDFQKIFCFIDLSKGNLLNLPEIKSLMSKYGYSIGDNEAKMILGRFDRNKSGQIGFKEFLEELNPRLQVFKKEI